MNKIQRLYIKLRQLHGRPSGQWQLWCKRPKTVREREEVIIGAILTQNTSWRNVAKAVGNLKVAKKCSLKKIAESAAFEKIKELIRPSGFYNTKSNYLVGVAKFFLALGGVKRAMRLDLGELRKMLLAQKGVGPETADSILNYALDSRSFVIDEYTRRIVKKEKISRSRDYNYLKKLFEENIKKDFAVYQDLHALIVIANKEKRRTKE